VSLWIHAPISRLLATAASSPCATITRITITYSTTLMIGTFGEKPGQKHDHFITACRHLCWMDCFRGFRGLASPVIHWRMDGNAYLGQDTTH
jgi:hypothetical protein